jgi:alpha-tubulin suppressor-like RCC1 family protein
MKNSNLMLAFVIQAAACGEMGSLPGDGSPVPDPGTAGSSPGGPRFVQVAPGGTYVCALADDGRVYCWGDNEDGQLGSGDTSPRTTPTLVAALVGVKQIAAGQDTMAGGTTCAILADDTLVCWGANQLGQLGRGDTTSAATPGPVLDEMSRPLDRVVQVSVSGNSGHACAVRQDHSLWCWGNNFLGQIARDPATGTEVLRAAKVMGLAEVAQVSAGSSNTCAVLVDGTVWCWGNNERFGSGADAGTICGSRPGLPCAKRPQQVGSDTGYRAVVAGSASCALKVDGRVACWGTADAREAFPGDDGRVHPTPVVVAGLANVEALSMSNRWLRATACALRADGSVWCWGHGFFNELAGHSRTLAGTASEVPVQIGDIPPASGIGVLGTFCTIAKADRSLWCWGSNAGGQLAAANSGDMTSSSFPTPARIPF